MPENAFLMIHDPAGVVMGTAIDMRAMAEALDKIKGSLLQGYAAKSGRPQEEIAPLMAAETWLDAKDALDLGFADRIAGPVRIAARFDVGRFRNAPPALIEVDAEIAGETADEDTSGNVAAIGDTDEEAAPSDPAAADPAAGIRGDATIETEGLGPPAEPDPPADPSVPSVEKDAVSAIAANIRAEALTHARAVVDLCRLAGQPQMAGRFLERDAGLDDVRAALLAHRVGEEPDISAAHPQPGRPSGARPWGDVIARTFRLKG
jgi:hypothetical protein